MNKKFRNSVYFFICILPEYMAHDILEEFLENSHFEDMTAGFLQRSKNLLWQMMHFKAWKKWIFTNNAY